MELDDFNVAEKILSTLDERQPLRGYPTQIDKDRLWNMRQHLRFLLETTWDEVGCRFQTVRKMGDLRDVMKPWEKRIEQEEHVVRALLWNSERPATSRSLYRQRKQLGELHDRYLSAMEWIDECRDSLERFMVIPGQHLSLAEQDVIRDEIYERARKLAHAGEECIALRDQENELEVLIKDGEAYFARNELLDFCLSKRYRLTPLDIANALAGLPFICWRRSADRCRKWKGEPEGLSFGIFRILLRVVKANVRRSDLMRDADKFLEAKRPTGNKFALADLRENRYYLRRSIAAVLEQGMRRADLAAAISREYWKRKSHPTAVDRAFAEEEKIVK
ncbi:MAG: hypothetical protein ACLPHP_21995 [Candidatus Sulfotelmatobacter sp.]